jgi:hypothetical protein
LEQRVSLRRSLWTLCQISTDPMASPIPCQWGVFLSIPTLVKRASRPKWLSANKMGRRRPVSRTIRGIEPIPQMVKKKEFAPEDLTSTEDIRPRSPPALRQRAIDDARRGSRRRQLRAVPVLHSPVPDVALSREGGRILIFAQRTTLCVPGTAIYLGPVKQLLNPRGAALPWVR